MPRPLHYPALLVAAIAASACAVQIELGASAVECFFEQVEGNNKITGSFEVVAGGLLDVDVTIYGPLGEGHYSVQRQRSGHFTVVAPKTGLYKLCFGNALSSSTEKTIAFSLHVGDDLFKDIARQEHITPLEKEITELADAVAIMADEQEYLFARERTTRETNESTNRRVLWFSLAEAAVLIAMGVAQVMFLRRFFEKKRGF